MEKEALSQMIEELKLDEKIEQDMIPNVDLYMDQVITLFEDKLTHTKRYKEDKLLTKTMINNYIKDKVLMPANKRKYTKKHILLMILLYDLKQILAIGDIKHLFDILIDNGEVSNKVLSGLYQIVLDLKLEEVTVFQKEVSHIEESIKTEVEQLSLEDIDEEKIMSMLQVIVLTEKANYYKRLAEKIVDEKIVNNPAKSNLL